MTQLLAIVGRFCRRLIAAESIVGETRILLTPQWPRTAGAGPGPVAAVPAAVPAGWCSSCRACPRRAAPGRDQPAPSIWMPAGQCSSGMPFSCGASAATVRLQHLLAVTASLLRIARVPGRLWQIPAPAPAEPAGFSEPAWSRDRGRPSRRSRWRSRRCSLADR